MKLASAVVIFCLVASSAGGQTRVFLSAGGSFSTVYTQNDHYYPTYGNSIYKTDGSYTTKGFKYVTFDIEVERKITKLAFVTGLRFFNSGYSNHYETNFSKLTCSHIGVPLLLRVNILNFTYLDVGAIGVYTPQATLDETALKGSALEVSDKGNIARYLAFRVGTNVQYSIVINRYFIAAYFIVFKNEVSGDFENKWNLRGYYRNNSLFIRDFSPQYQMSQIGLKVGMRIR